MSLKIIRRQELSPDLKVIEDVELGFLKFRLLDSELNRRAIATIEDGSYLDEESFVDRFGYKLYKRFLSTGCKAALCVINLSEYVINTIECGVNALSFIIDNCTEGTIIISDESVSLPDNGSTINVEFGNRKFTTVRELNEYLL